MANYYPDLDWIDWADYEYKPVKGISGRSTDLSIHRTEENLFGPLVTVERCVVDGESGSRIETVQMEAYLAVSMVTFGAENGIRVTRARILYNGVLDVWSFSE